MVAFMMYEALQARTCPVCQLEGVETNLGNLPYHHHRLQFDFTLADIIRKLFPRPEVEQQIEERRQDERRFMEQASLSGDLQAGPENAGPPVLTLQECVRLHNRLNRALAAAMLEQGLLVCFKDVKRLSMVDCWWLHLHFATLVASHQMIQEIGTGGDWNRSCRGKAASGRGAQANLGSGRSQLSLHCIPHDL